MMWTVPKMSLRRLVLTRLTQSGRKMEKLAPTKLNYEIQQLIFFIQKYCEKIFNGKEIPRKITDFLNGLKILIDASSKKYKFSIDEEADDSHILSSMEGSYMYMTRKGSDAIQNKLKGYKEIFPYKEDTPEHPVTPSDSLSPLSSLSSEEYNKNGACTSGLTKNVSSDSSEKKDDDERLKAMMRSRKKNNFC